MMAAELAERVGLRTAVHAYIDVVDKGETLVGQLGFEEGSSVEQVKRAVQLSRKSTANNTARSMEV